MGDWHEDVLRHKYAPLPDDGPRYRKKSRKRHVKCDHKHEYEVVAIDCGSYYIDRSGRHDYYHKGIRCKVCGKLYNFYDMRDKDWVTADIRLFEVKDLFELLRLKYLPDSMEVKGE